MRRAIRTLVVFLLFLALLPAGAARAGDRPFLWKVGAGKSVVWLLGSIHVARPDIYPLDRRIERAFEDSDSLVVEVDAAGMAGLEMAGKMVARATYPPDDSIERHIPRSLFEQTAKRLGRHGMPPAQWSRFKPWFVAMTLTMAELQSMGIVAQNGIDIHFLQRARGKKKILELESAESQLALFDGLDERQQALFLEYTLRDVDNLSEHVDELFGAWRSGDAGRLDKILKEPVQEAQELLPIYKKLFDERNEKMAERIDGYLRIGGTYFVVAGAGHLVGEKGLLELLGKRHPIERP